MGLPLCSSLSPCLLGFLAFGAWEDSEIGRGVGGPSKGRGEGMVWARGQGG